MVLRSYNTRRLKNRRPIWRPVSILIIILLLVIWWPRSKPNENNPQNGQVNQDPESFRVFISPGDGGEQLGGVYPKAGSPTVKGKDINLAIAKATQRALEKEGIGVLLSREDDQFIDALDRKKKAEEFKANVAVAIYTDSYYDDPLYTGFSIVDYKQIDWEEHYKQRTALAAELNRSLEERLQLDQVKGRGIFTRNSAFVIDGPTLALIVGFISNDAERERLINEEYQWKIANSITDALVLYRDRLRWQKSSSVKLEPEQPSDSLRVPF